MIPFLLNDSASELKSVQFLYLIETFWYWIALLSGAFAPLYFFQDTKAALKLSEAAIVLGAGGQEEVSRENCK